MSRGIKLDGFGKGTTASGRSIHRPGCRALWCVGRVVAPCLLVVLSQAACGNNDAGALGKYGVRAADAPPVPGDAEEQSAYSVTIEDDFSYPQYVDRDYGLEEGDIHLSNDSPDPGEAVTITVDIHNYGLCQAGSAWGWYSPTGRSCWAEWDFDYPTSETVDILFRCQDKDATVHWRMELDGVHLTDVSVPRSATQQSWKLVTVHNVPVTPGPHTVFLGTYQMDYYPDYHLDWVEIGGVHIEAETYDRMGGNDPNGDYRGVATFPRDITVQIWDGDPAGGGTLLFEDFVGDTNVCMDHGHNYPGHTYTCYYIESGGEASVELEWTPDAPGAHEICVVVDPDDSLTEIDEENNMVCRAIVLDDCNGNGIPDECDLDCGEAGGPCDVPGCGQSEDCQPNGVPDECDIAEGTSADDNGNGTPDECEIMAYLDIKPGSCPNPLNRKAQGKLPVAILGTADFDVSMIDVSSVQLARADGVGGSVRPLEGPPGPHSTMEDVGTPFDDEPCDCHELEGDGIEDLSMKFSVPSVVDILELNDLERRASVELIVSGNLSDGTGFKCSDCVLLVGRSNSSGKARLPRGLGR